MNVHDPNPQGAHVVVVNQCHFCGTVNHTRVPVKAYHDWHVLAFPIQVAMPDVSVVKRETLMSGTCSPCQDKIFTEEEEDAAFDKEQYEEAGH